MLKLSIFALGFSVLLTGCGDGSVEVKTKSNGPTPVIIEKSEPTKVIIEKNEPARETTKTTVVTPGGTTTKETTR
jgi:hypothetical protein